jgi:hypothetical protein
MDEEIDWSLTTWAGSRREQHRRFLALSLREKLEVVESLAEMAALFAPDPRGRGRGRGRRVEGEEPTGRGRPGDGDPGGDADPGG